MFGILGILTGITGIIKGWFHLSTAKQIGADIDKAIPVIEKTLPVVQEGIKTVGETATAIGQATDSVATIVKSENDVAIADTANLKPMPGSWFANNVRPLVTLMFAVLIVLEGLGYVKLNLSDTSVNLMLALMGVHYTGRSWEKIMNLVAQRPKK